MKVLVIPDIHLKPWMFKEASRLMKAGAAEKTVCLMDIADDWGKQADIPLYERTYEAAINYAKEYPDTLWCWGNHDFSYIHGFPESGYSIAAKIPVKEKLEELFNTVPLGNFAFVHRIDNVLFSHAGLLDPYVRYFAKNCVIGDADSVISQINTLKPHQLWHGASPIWARPQYNGLANSLYKADALLQVVGHTPMKEVVRTGNLISTDVFSTYNDGSPIGSQEFLLLDTKTWEHRTAH